MTSQIEDGSAEGGQTLLESPNSRLEGVKQSIATRDIINNIKALYAAGVPLFTKEAIRQLGNELKEFRNGKRAEETIFKIRGIDGNLVDFKFTSIMSRPPDPTPIYDGNCSEDDDASDGYEYEDV